MIVPEVKQTLPKELMRNMRETMQTAIPGLFVQEGYDTKRVKEIFKNHVLKTPLTENLAKSLKLPDNRLAKEIDLLHKLYNQPDDALHVSAINDQPDMLRQFQEAMLNTYKGERSHCQKPAAADPAPVPPPPAPPPVDLAKFDAPRKRKEAEEDDEKIAKELQAQFDAEAKKEEVKAPEAHEKRRKVQVECSGDSVSIINGVVFRNGVRVDNVANVHNFFSGSVVSIGNMVVAGGQASDAPPKGPDTNGNYHLGVHERCAVPEKTTGCRVDAGMYAKIALGKGCQEITINADMYSKITLGPECRKITIRGNMYSKVDIDDACSDITLELGMYAKHSLGKNCQNITVNGHKVA